MRKSPMVLLSVLAFVLAACSKPPEPKLTLGSGAQFVPNVVDFLDDVGIQPSIALDSNGNPHLVYFGFQQEMKPGEIPVVHPIGSPTLPAVLDAGLSDGIWTHGAVADDVKDLTAQDVTGTGVATDSSDKLHVVWSTTSGLWYATDAAGDFAPKQIVKGDVSGPSIAVDPKGTVWVAYYENGVVLAAPLRDGRLPTGAPPVDKTGACTDCPPLRTALAVAGGTPLVAYTDGATKSAMAAFATPRGWAASVIEDGVGGWGIAATTEGDGTPHVSYYATDGEVREATADKGLTSWGASKVGDYGTTGQFPAGLSTSIAVDDSGASYVAWYDPGADQVDAASDASGSFEPLEVQDTFGGQNPVIAVAPDGLTVYLGWYDHVNGNLELGQYGPSGKLELAKPSPTAAAGSPSPIGGTQGAACEVGPDSLKISALGSAFDKPCMAAPAGKPFTITFENKDPFFHNVEILDQGPATNPAAKVLFAPPNDEGITGPDTVDYKVDPLDAGSYFFFCFFHPATMTGTFVVQK